MQWLQFLKTLDACEIAQIIEGQVQFEKGS